MGAWRNLVTFNCLRISAACIHFIMCGLRLPSRETLLPADYNKELSCIWILTTFSYGKAMSLGTTMILRNHCASSLLSASVCRTGSSVTRSSRKFKCSICAGVAHSDGSKVIGQGCWLIGQGCWMIKYASKCATRECQRWPFFTALLSSWIFNYPSVNNCCHFLLTNNCRAFA